MLKALRAGLAAALLLTGCAAEQGYRAATGGGSGYSETEIEPGRWRVGYRGGAGDTAETVELYVLRRAAEITLDAGGDHFLLLSRNATTQGRASPGVVFATPWGGWSSGDGAFGGVTLSTATRSRPIAEAEIIVRSGPKPPDELNAYDARAVQAALGEKSPGDAAQP